MSVDEKLAGYKGDTGGYVGDKCATCVVIPEMEQMSLMWEHPRPCEGIQYCPMCKEVYGAFYCPYIPIFD